MSKALSFAKLGKPVKSSILKEDTPTGVRLMRSSTYELCTLTAFLPESDITTYLEFNKDLGKHVVLVRHLEAIKD